MKDINVERLRNLILTTVMEIIKIPKDWKSGRVPPIYNKGDKRKWSN